MEQGKPLQIYVALKNPGKLNEKVKHHPFSLPSTPHTFRELIELMVRVCVRSYIARRQSEISPTPLTDEQWDSMAEVGKFAFGVYDTDALPEEAQAIETALSAMEDGLVRVFRGTEELTDLHAPLSLSEGEVLTFVRLTLLSGCMW